MSLVPTSPPTPPHSPPAEPPHPERGPGTAPGPGARGWAGVRLPAPAPAQWWRSALYEEERGAGQAGGRAPDARNVPGAQGGTNGQAEPTRQAEEAEEAGGAERFGPAGQGEPEWARFVTQALAHATAAPHGPGEQIRSVPGAGPEGRLVHPLWPFLTAAGIRFHAGRPLAADPAEAADRRAVWEGARRHLAAGLVALAGRTLTAELRAARLAGRLRGADPALRFDHFVRTQAARGALADLLCRRHPVLARLLAERCLTAVAAAGELLDRYRADRPALAALLDPGQQDRRTGTVEAGRSGADAPAASTTGPENGSGSRELSAVRFGLGDPHAGGRTVALLEFGAGRPGAVYKPRPLGAHARWNEALGRLGEHLPDLAARPVRLLERDGYGWTAFVPAEPCRDDAGLDAFHARLGAQLALLHALDATDIHAENLVAAGDQPVVVDVETLFHPSWTPRTDGGADPAARGLAASVHRTALLPNPHAAPHAPLDTSALAGGPAADCPTPRPTWAEPGLDTMHLVYAPTPWPGAANLPAAATPAASAAPADPCDHVESLLRGFRAAYRTIAAHTEELCGPGDLLSWFEDETVRVVVRPSQTYAELLADATDPESMREPAARLAAFGALWDETGHDHLLLLAPYEAAELAAGDIPVLTATPGSRILRTSRGRELPALLAEPPLAAARAKIRAMGPADLARQEWLIRAALATKSPPPPHRAVPTHAPSVAAPPAEPPPSEEPCTERPSAGWDAERPSAGRDAGPSSAGWDTELLCIGRDTEPPSAEPASAWTPDVAPRPDAQPPAAAPGARPPTVAAPAAGPRPAGNPTSAEPVSVAVQVGELLLDAAWRGAGRANWVGVQDLGEGEWAVLAMGMGLGDGYCGPALFLGELGRVTGASRFTAAAAEAARPLPRMLRLLAAHPELAAAVGPGGFSGLGGVAYATARLAELLGAESGLGNELAAALPDALTALTAAADAPDACPDVADGLAGALLAARAVHARTPHPVAAALLRDLPARIAAAPAPNARGFLHGRAGLAYTLAAAAPGGLARTEPLSAAGDLSWCSGLAGEAALGGAARERHLTAATAEDRAPLRDLSLCHGESGVLEPLAARPGPEAEALRRRAGERLAGAVARAAARDGIHCGTPLGVPTAGLLTGLAGIGHGLLRLALGATIPSVLLLAPSGPAEARLTTERASTPWTTT